ncbi:uncharacterized protein LOC114158046 [Xiphophorus couchianus]|uniref:uncharacterized protein LOC114136135 n=3 Tax=Xiphophorus TaxID=8082 RepID=UPI001015D4AF|nr:uncharacterized protein LOC114136135 [Xiphophorus couchianus]XP_027871878.1 uncharacterized protein LOC114143766 [Xiphophorus couchianus]XP_027895162.1 uncharacterized protein LOC114158046 [Xiphophorus couchianus]
MFFPNTVGTVSTAVEGEVSVRGRCHRSMKKKEEAHYLQVTLDSFVVPVELKYMSCSCTAGKALCNHMVGLLFQTAHYSTMGYKTVPLPLSCTSSLQTWHRPRTKGVAPEATNDMTVCKPVAREKTRIRTSVKCTLYRAYAGPLPDPHIEASGEKLKEIRPQPGICKLLYGLQNLTLVDSKFGPVPFGSVLSYQCPPEMSRDIIKHPDAPEFPQLPVDGYSFRFPLDFEPNYRQLCHLESLKISRKICAAIEAETRQQSECQLWTEVRKPRLTASRFREVCHVRGQSSAKALATRILRRTPQTAAMKRGLDLEPEILKQYSDLFDVSVMQCGFIIHPDAPHLGASPDAKVFNPKEMPPFGLAEVKSCNVDNVAQVNHLVTIKGQACLKKSHKYYYQVQGQLAVSGLQWCDFITDTHTDFTVERIFRDEELILSMRQRLDHFYHDIYMDVFLNGKP